MSDAPTAASTVWRAGVIEDFARSELFDKTFEEGMELVEVCAAYLDGVGRQDSRMLSRNAALAYAAESMRLTTRLMQVASWLLVQRAVREGDMEPSAACEPRYRVGDEAVNQTAEIPEHEGLPSSLIELVGRSERLYERVRHLDQRMYMDGEAAVEAPNPVLSQFTRLQDVFGKAS